MHHIHRTDWLLTPEGQPRGYIQPQFLKELWFHTGTICNLSCSFCLEGSAPGDRRIEPLTFQDARPFIEEALTLGVEQFSFTGGEPFTTRDIVRILDYALEHRPCLVLTNGTKPLQARMAEVLPLSQKPHPLRFRISLDYPDPARHDAARGKGNFQRALESLAQLHQSGFSVSVARLETPGENPGEVNRAYQDIFRKVGLPGDVHIVVFPNLYPPGETPSVPHITEDCMTRYHTAHSRAEFMCNFSKMVLKKDGWMSVYACTLVDDDRDYDLGATLREAMRIRIMLKHHRCYACFSSGTSCSELNFEENDSRVHSGMEQCH